MSVVNTKIIQNYRRIATILFVAVLAFAPFLQFEITHAAALNQTFVRFDRMSTSTATTGTVCARGQTTASTEATVRVTFPSGYTLGAAGTFTVDTTNLSWPTGGTAWPGINTATNVASQTVTFPSGDLPNNTTLYCFNWINSAAVTVTATPGASQIGTVETWSSAPAVIDSAQYATAAISNDSITITATVPPVFSFALSANSDALGTLGSGVVSTSPTPRTVTISTNAKNGWLVWARSLNSGLYSAAVGGATQIPSITAGSNGTLSAGTTGYNMGVTTAAPPIGPTPTIATGYINNSTLGRGGGLDTTLRQIASSTGPNDTAVLTLHNNVAIDATVPAATDYTDTVTLVGAGLF